MNVSLEDIKNVKQKYCLGESLKFFLAVTWCDISQGPQLFLYILRQNEKNQKRYICAFHKRFIGRNGYHDGKQHHLKKGVGEGGDWRLGAGWRWAPKALHQISFEMRWGHLQAVLWSKEFGLHCSRLTFIFHCLNRLKTGFLGCSECFISVFHLWRILALWTEIHSLSIHWGTVQ